MKIRGIGATTALAIVATVGNAGSREAGWHQGDLLREDSRRSNLDVDDLRKE